MATHGTVILIRHADVTASPEDDPAQGPPLNAAGRARAQELRHVLADAGVGTIFVTSLLRSGQTAEPIAADLNIAPTVKDAVSTVIEAIRALPEASIALVIGHSNTVPDIIAGLDGPSLAILDGMEFDNLFVLSGPRLTHLRYGA